MKNKEAQNQDGGKLERQSEQQRPEGEASPL